MTPDRFPGVVMSFDSPSLISRQQNAIKKTEITRDVLVLYYRYLKNNNATTVKILRFEVIGSGSVRRFRTYVVLPTNFYGLHLIQRIDSRLGQFF